MAPEHLTVSPDMLSNFCNEIKAENWKPMQKLVPNLLDKTNYVWHYRNLQFYVKHGLVLSKIHRIISFDQKRWLKPWIDYCTEARKMARNEFESDLAKIQANATFGKTMEQVRHRVNVRLICDPNKLAKAVSRSTFRRAEIINDDLTLVRGARQRVMLNKPISVGFTILEISKLITYEFYYDYLKPKYLDRCKLLFADTDSFCCHIQTEDLYKTWLKILSYLTLVIFSRPIRCTRRPITELWENLKAKPGRLRPSNLLGLGQKCIPYQSHKIPKSAKSELRG